MSMTRTQLRSHVTFNLGNRSDMDSQVNDYLDWSLEDAASLRNWRDMLRHDETMRTAEDKVHYPTPLLLKDILECRYVNEGMSQPLTYLDPVTFRQLYPHPESDGASIPGVYTWEADYIKIYPLAAETGLPLELYCSFWPSPFDTDDDVCPISRIDRALIAAATAYAYESLRDTQWTFYWRKQFMDHLRRAGRAEGPPSAWTPAYASVRVQQWGGGRFFVPPATVGGAVYETTSL